MFRLTGVVVMVVLGTMLAACGGNLRHPDPVPAEFTGRWDGLFSVRIGDDAPRHYDGTVSVSADGQVAHLSGLCPDGTGTADMLGFDGVLAWEGLVECIPSALSGCFVSLKYMMATARIEDGGLLVDASGSARRTPFTSPCDERVPLSMSFVGVRANAVE